MAGHSKWSNIKHKKEKQDAKKAKIFTKLGREITVAVKMGGSDPAMNNRLKQALQKARSANMPGDKIDGLIQKALGDEGSTSYEELTYEGYGIGGAAVMVDVLTDNRNRTAGEVRHAFEKYGGNLGENGCVSWMFDTKGQIRIESDGDDSDEITLAAIEAGAEDVEYDEGTVTIYTVREQLDSVSEKIQSMGYSIDSSEIARIPRTTVLIEDADQAENLVGMMEMLEDNDDVQSTWSNFDFSDEISKKLS